MADENSLSDEATLTGATRQLPASEVSLGNERTLVDGRSEQDTVIDDIEVVDLEARYRVEGRLGKGGMGAVLLATDTRLDRKVAIKRILGEAAGNQMAVQRFLTEAKAIAALNHPNIVQLYDYGRAKDGPFLIMEYVDGGSLLDRCRDSALPLDEAIDLACQLCDGLSKAHDLGIFHRDIKPANVLLTKGGTPKLTDFGLAKAQASDHGHTVTGAVLGTPDFMPPEQRHDASLVDHRSDLWSLAATVYQMVTGRSPKVIRLHELPQALQAVMARAFEDAKDARYQSAREFRDALKTCCRSLEASAVAASLGEGQCPRCGVQNDSKRKFCRGCAASLEAPCLKCGQVMPMWDDICGACGTKQSTLLDVRRSAFEDDRVSAEALLANFRFTEAEEVAARHSQWVHDRFEDGTHWAREFLHRIKETRSKQLGLLSAALADATRYESGGDFPGAIACLEKIPIPLQSVVVPGHESAKSAIERLRKIDAENSHLERFIQGRQRDGKVTGLLPYVEKLIKRLPQRADLRALKAMLEEHERKVIDVRDEALLGARASLEQRDYDRAIEILSQIDPAVETEDVTTVRRAAQDAKKRIEELSHSLWEMRGGDAREGDVELQLARVEELIALVGSDRRAEALRADMLAAVQRRRQSAIAKATALIAEYRYSDAVKILSSLPQRGRSPEIEFLLKEAERTQSLVEHLSSNVQSNLSASNFPKVVQALGKYLQLKPNDTKAAELWKQYACQEQEVAEFLLSVEQLRRLGRWSDLIKILRQPLRRSHPAVNQMMNRLYDEASRRCKRCSTYKRIGLITQIGWSLAGVLILVCWAFVSLGTNKTPISLTVLVGCGFTLIFAIGLAEDDDVWLAYFSRTAVYPAVCLLFVGFFEPSFFLGAAIGFAIGAIPSMAVTLAWAVESGFFFPNLRWQRLLVHELSSFQLGQSKMVAQNKPSDGDTPAIGLDLSGKNLTGVSLHRDSMSMLKTLVSEIPAIAVTTEDGAQLVGVEASVAAARGSGVKQIQGFLALLGMENGTRLTWGVHGEAGLVDGGSGTQELVLSGHGIAPESLACRVVFDCLQNLQEPGIKQNTHRFVACLPASAGTLGQAALRKAVGPRIRRTLVTTHAEAFATYWEDRRDGAPERVEPQLVVHWSATTFEVSVFRASEGCVQIVATLGDALLGHDHVTQRLVDMLLAVTDRQGVAGDQRLWRLAEVAQQQLARFSETWVKAMPQKAIRVQRTDYEQSCRNEIEGLRTLLAEVCKDAHITPDAVMRIHVAGEHAQSPQLKAVLETMFVDASVTTSARPELLAAHGAALAAAVLDGNIKGYLLLPVWPHRIGIETADGITETLVTRNATYPLTTKRVFETARGEEGVFLTSMGLILVEGERLIAKDNECIGAIAADGAPGSSFEIELSITADSCLEFEVAGLAVDGLSPICRSLRLPIFHHRALGAGRPKAADEDSLAG